jgi:ketosteroid isomerase-like protein
MNAMTAARRRHARVLAVPMAGALAFLSACTSSTEASSVAAEAEAAIAEFNRQYLAAINGADIEALADLTTEDHMMIMSGGEPLAGKEVLVDAMTGAFERFEFDESWTPEETVVSGDLAYQRGSFVVNATPKAGGEPARTTGNFLRIYRRQPDGSWLMVRDMFNSDTAGAQSTGETPITENPLPDPIAKRGLRVGIVDVLRLPDTRGLLPEGDTNPAGTARVNFVVDAPDGRRFANDQRGIIYRLDDGDVPELYLDMHNVFPLTIYDRVQSGFNALTFHPEFADNGLFYTVHGEVAENNPGALDFIPPGYSESDVTHHNVISEWRANDPGADTFEGARRELLRVAHVTTNMSHPFGFVGFNPTAEPGDDDYGLLYTSGSDLGFSNGGGPNSRNAAQTQRLDTVATAILRIDPRSPSESGGTRGLGDYTIPLQNPYAGDSDPATLGEIYAHGFRNAHRLSWDLEDGTMFAFDIGMNHIEEVNIVHAGGNYGWMAREGYWENGRFRPDGELNELYELPDAVLEGEVDEGFIYPVAFYDHDEGRAISGGFAYRGEIEALEGKVVFGDVQAGRLFAADIAALKAADDGVPLTVAPIEEIQLYVRDAQGNERDVSFQELVETTKGESVSRSDLHLSLNRDGEIFVTSRQDGTIRLLAP